MDVLNIIMTTAEGMFSAFIHSAFFFMMKIFLVIYSTVLVVDVILLVYLGDVRKQLRNMRMGTGVKKTSKRTDVREWDAIIGRLQSLDGKQYLIAILEADRFVYKSLALQGYSGGTFAERLAQVPQGSFLSLNAVRDVHALSNKIVQKEDIQISQEQARNALGIYEQFLQSIDIL